MNNKQLEAEVARLKEKCDLFERAIIGLLRKVEKTETVVTEVATHNKRVTAAVARVNKQLREYAA